MLYRRPAENQQVGPRGQTFGHALQDGFVGRAVVAEPALGEEPRQSSTLLAISRARDGAELVTDDAWKLSDQLERATGERVAALDGAAMEGAHETAFSLETDHERDGDRAARGT